MIGPGTGAASFDAFGASKYQNRRTVSIKYIMLFITSFFSNQLMNSVVLDE